MPNVSDPYWCLGKDPLASRMAPLLPMQNQSKVLLFFVLCLWFNFFTASYLVRMLKIAHMFVRRVAPSCLGVFAYHVKGEV